MDACCDAKSGEVAALRRRQGRVLIAVLAINALMFCIEFGAGVLAGSTALQGDSLILAIAVCGNDVFPFRRCRIALSNSGEPTT